MNDAFVLFELILDEGLLLLYTVITSSKEEERNQGVLLLEV